MYSELNRRVTVEGLEVLVSSLEVNATVDGQRTLDFDVRVYVDEAEAFDDGQSLLALDFPVDELNAAWHCSSSCC